jgi:hypothetical protein
MRTSRLIGAGMLLLYVAAPTTSNAQATQDAENGVTNLFRALFGPNWNLFAHGGLSTNGRFMLQDATAIGGGQRALKTEDAFNVGIGAGVDLLPRTGFRLSYTFMSSDLVFRTDKGDGSELFDVDDGGTLQGHTAAIELVRFMLPPQSFITPYATAGLLGTWWVLDDESAMVGASGGSTQFRLGALASFGFQAALGDGFSARLEVASASVRNPFTGNESFEAFGGSTIDEPGRVNHTDFRLAVVYSLGKRDPSSYSSNGERRVR